jgi:phosphotriesterase-related protein
VSEAIVQTVTGQVPVDALGRTMMHEHLLIDASCIFEPPSPDAADLVDAPVDISRRAELVYHAFGSRDNLVIDDLDLAVREVLEFALAGGSAIVDCTSDEIGRDPGRLQEISTRTGVLVVMGTGHYQDRCLPDRVRSLDEDELTAEMVGDIVDGVGATGIRAGVIGEIGVQHFSPDELRVLRAAARAQQATGAALNVHQIFRPAEPRRVLQILDEVEQAGGDPGRTVLSHMDRTGRDWPLQQEVLRRGATIEYDVFGYENTHSAWGSAPPTDAQRVTDLARIAEAGYISQVVVAQDICLKTMLTHYGGHGYAHILRRVVPGFRWAGFSEADVDTVLVANPRRLLGMPGHA